MSEILINFLFYGYLIFVSVTFWFKDSNPTKLRLLVSAHGLLVLVIFGIAFLVFLSGVVKTWILYMFFALFILPIASIIVSLKHFQGSKFLHIFHVFTVLAMLWVLFVGGMMVTNDFI